MANTAALSGTRLHPPVSCPSDAAQMKYVRSRDSDRYQLDDGEGI